MVDQDHEVLPECVEKLTRLETQMGELCDNHLTHIYEELKTLGDSIKKTQTFVVTQIIAFGTLTIAALVQIILIK